jgi:hypothetical protein
MAKKLHDSEKTALHRLYKAGAAGIPLEPLTVFIDGETMATWLRLVARGYAYGLNGRLRMTSQGRAAYKDLGMTEDKFLRLSGQAA